MTNKFPGYCSKCGSRVPAGAGAAVKVGLKWQVVCPAHAPAQAFPVQVGNQTTERKLDASGRITMPYEKDAIPLLRAMPGARWQPDTKQWSVSLLPGDRARVLELAGKLALEVAPELARIEQSAQAVAAAAIDGAQLYPFQIAGVDWLAKRDRGLLGDDMGLGKTVQTLMALPKAARAIVVAPAAVKYNWQAECKRWRPDLRARVLEGRRSFRWPTAGELIVTNYDILPEWLEQKKMDGATYATHDHVPAEEKQAAAGVIVVVDEAHKCKSHKAARSKRVKGLGKLTGRIWGLTGTPLLNRPFDLWGVLSTLGIEREIFGKWDRFLQLFRMHQNRWGGWEYGTPDPGVPDLLRRAMLRRRREEVLPDLPGKQYSTMLVNGISDDLRGELDEAWLAWQEAEGGTPRDLPPFEEFSRLRAELAASRIPAVIEVVEDHEEQDVPLVVFSAHRAPIDELGRREGWATITGDTPQEKRQAIVEAFQAGQLKGIGATITAAGVGLTLTRAWKMLFVDLDWVPANNAQAEDRICRIGQTAGACEYVRMVSDHPLDIHVLGLLARKIALVNSAVERLLPPALAARQPGETEEEHRARIAQAQAKIDDEIKAAAEAERKAKKARCDEIHDRQRARVTRDLLPITDRRAGDIRDAFKRMLGVCDGAKLRDGAGFNKPDACIAHFLLTYGLDDPSEVETAYWMLSHYHRQLHEAFPGLFNAYEGEVIAS